jgi:hypothetical protein
LETARSTDSHGNLRFENDKLGLLTDGREDGPRGVVSGETGLAHARSVIDHEGRDFFVRL